MLEEDFEVGLLQQALLNQRSQRDFFLGGFVWRRLSREEGTLTKEMGPGQTTHLHKQTL
jgi:hypothetical protein